MSLPGFETLAAVGVTHIMVGIILRGFAAQSRRELARRKQHRLAERRSADALLNAQLERPPTWQEKHFGRIANGVLIVGVGLTVLAFLRR